MSVCSRPRTRNVFLNETTIAIILRHSPRSRHRCASLDFASDANWPASETPLVEWFENRLKIMTTAKERELRCAVRNLWLARGPMTQSWNSWFISLIGKPQSFPRTFLLASIFISICCFQLRTLSNVGHRTRPSSNASKTRFNIWGRGWRQEFQKFR